MYREEENLHVIAIGIALGILIFLGFVLLAAEAKEMKQWRAFRDSHECKVIGVGKGGSTISSSGSYVSLPDTVSYLCNDGLTYTRKKE